MVHTVSHTSTRSPRRPVHRRIVTLGALLAAATLAASGCGVQGGSSEFNDSDLLGDDTTTPPEDTGGDTTPEPDVTTVSVIGQACADKAACDGGICATLLPGGYCTQSCEDGACPSGTECRQINNFPFCMQTCAADDDCRQGEGYSCLGGVCNIECSADADCDPTHECVDHACQMRTATQALGEACTSSSECLSDYCLDGAAGGVCSEPCGAAGACTLADWNCQNLVPVDGEFELRLCAPTPELLVEVIELGTSGENMGFDVGDDAVSFMVIAEGQGRETTYALHSLRNPAGTTVAGYFNDYGFTEPFRMNPGDGQVSAIFPNNAEPSLQMMPGRWTIEALGFARPCEWGCPANVGCFNNVCDMPSGFDRISVVIKSTAGGSEPAAATIDVNVFLPAGTRTGLSAASAPQDAELQGALNRMGNYWGERGISLGEVRFYDIGSDFAVVGSDSEMRQMFDEQSIGAPNALNVFFVRDLNIGGDAVGVAGGIPGPHGVSGTGGSGVVVQLMGGQGRATGDNVTHELGHFLGYYHVSEIPYNGIAVHDIVRDTPQCDWNRINNGQYDPCMDNIMFPTLLTGFGIPQSISPEQGRIGRLSPIAR